jgi:phage-related protein
VSLPLPKSVFWVGSSRKDLRALPEEVKDEIGQDLFEVQMGGTPVSAKPLTGFGPQVLEIVIDHNTDTFRAVYTVRYADRVYVVHVFQKKSKKGRALPKEDKERIEARLKAVVQSEKERRKKR